MRYVLPIAMVFMAGRAAAGPCDGLMAQARALDGFLERHPERKQDQAFMKQRADAHRQADECTTKAEQRKIAEQAQAEQRADDAAKEKQRREDALAKLLNDPKALATYYGARICADEQKKKAAISEIAAEKRTAKESGGGVIDMQNIYAWQQDVAEANADLKLVRGEAAKKKIRPQSCSDGFAARLATCMALTPIIVDATMSTVRYDGDNPNCAEQIVQDFLAMGAK